MAGNNAGHTRAGTEIPVGNVTICYMKGSKWHCVQVLLAGVLVWLKQQVCTGTLMFLATRMH